MNKVQLATAADSVSPALKPPTGLHSTLLVVTDHANDAGHVIVVEVSADEVNYVPVVVLNKASAVGALIANLTGPDKIGSVQLDGGANLLYRFRKTDAVAGTPIVWFGVTSPSL